MNFRKVDMVKIKKDEEENMHYVEVEDALAPEISFLKTSCPDKKVMYVKCSDFGTYLIAFWRWIPFKTENLRKSSTNVFNFKWKPPSK
jgi:hypothetical protein